MALAKRLLRNFVLLLAGNVLGQLAFFLGLLRLARVLGPAEFGVWNFAQAWLLYLFRGGELGLEVLGIREASRKPEETGQWISSLLVLRAGLAIILFVVTFAIAIAGLFPRNAAPIVIIFSIAVFPMAFILEWVYEAHQRILYVSLARIGKGLLFAALVFLFVSNSSQGGVAAALYVLSLVVPIGVVLWFGISQYGLGSFRYVVRHGLATLREALPIGLATLLSQYSLFLGTLVVGYLMSETDLGYYTAGHRLVIFLWAYVIVSSNRVLLPNLSRSFQVSVVRFSEFVMKFFRLSVLVALPFGFIGIALAQSVLPLLYSAQYTSSVIVFQVLMCALVIAIVRSIFEIGLVASGNQRGYLRSIGFLAIAYTVVTPLMTVLWGITGAALASVVAELFLLAYFLAAFPYTRFRSLLPFILKPAGAILPGVALLVLFAGTSPGWRVVIGLAAYAVLLVAVRGVDLEDVALLKKMIQNEGAQGAA